jgi:hypothetical protein
MPQMAPVYFQTSQWLRGYLEKPMYTGGYQPGRAQSYANGILNALPNPPAGPVAKLGVANNPFLDLNYVQAAWVQGQPTLLLKSCGFPGGDGTKAGENNGQTSYSTWRYAFSQLFANDNDFQGAVAGAPMFSIIDTNSAHHLSAPLVERAVNRADLGRLGGNPAHAMLVVNFDCHTDYGTTALGTPVTCQSWGRFVSNAIPNVYGHALADAYLQMGTPSAGAATWTTAVWHPAAVLHPAQAKTPVKTGIGTNSVADQLDMVVGQINPNALPLDAYVSLDRDLLKQSYTQYDDGAFPPDAGIEGVKECLTRLVQHHHADIVGFDICGLPTYPGSSSRSGPPINADQAMEMAKNQIIDLWNFVQQL